jgi:predicted transcriptional regulator
MKVLHVKVAEPVREMLDRAQATMEALDAGESPEPYFGIGFESLEQMLGVLSPRRWALLEALSGRGPSPAEDLAAALSRDAAEVAEDLALLKDWGVVEQTPDDRFPVPWDKVDLRLCLARRAA